MRASGADSYGGARTRARTVCGMLITTVGIATVGLPMACSDLFHGTDDIRTACARDAAALGCAAPASSAGPDASDGSAPAVDFCAWSSQDARHYAEHACAWLGACETPLGRNAMGSCLFEGLLAYDCAANPAHRPKGVTRDLWACLAVANSCDAVRQCLLPRAVSCVVGASATCVDDSVGSSRTICDDGGVHVENCALWSERCAAQDGGATCGSFAAPFCANGTNPVGCGAGQLLCGADGPSSVLFDCTGSGGQNCGGFPMQDAAAWLACTPEDAGTSAACDPTVSVTCEGGTANSCPTGIPEVLACDTLLATDGGCTAGSLSPPYDWTSPCGLVAPQCGHDACGDGGPGVATTLAACVRGAVRAVDCSALGLGPCQSTSSADGEAMVSCSPR